MKRCTTIVWSLASLMVIGAAATTSVPFEHADEPHVRSIDLGDKRLFVQIDFVDARTGFVVGGNAERGTPSGLMRTDDGGETWRSLETGADSRLYDVSWPTKEVGIATGFAGCVIRTEDGGDTWMELPGFENAWVPGVHFLSAQRGFAAGSQRGMLLVLTEDGGRTWRSIVERVPEEARSIDLRALHFVNERVGMACGADGLIIRTTDGGETWSRCETVNEQAWLKTISFPTNTTGYIAGSHSVVLRTDDGGATWRNLPVPGLVKVNGIAFISAERGIAAGAEGELFYTTDGATTWHELPPAKTSLTNATAAPNGVIWVTTEAGCVLCIDWPDTHDDLAAPPPKLPAEPDGAYRQFDFWIGEWVVKNADGQQVGTSRIEKVENGFAIEEFWTNMQGGTGRSLNYVDPKDGKWKQVWVSAGGNVVYYTGEYRDGAMQFTGESINRDGTVEIARASFRAFRNGTVRQFIEHSRDDGETWHVYFDGYYHPMK